PTPPVGFGATPSHSSIVHGPSSMVAGTASTVHGPRSMAVRGPWTTDHGPQTSRSRARRPLPPRARARPADPAARHQLAHAGLGVARRQRGPGGRAARAAQSPDGGQGAAGSQPALQLAPGAEHAERLPLAVHRPRV